MRPTCECENGTQSKENGGQCSCCIDGSKLPEFKHVPLYSIELHILSYMLKRDATHRCLLCCTINFPTM